MNQPSFYRDLVKWYEKKEVGSCYTRSKVRVAISFVSQLNFYLSHKEAWLPRKLKLFILLRFMCSHKCCHGSNIHSRKYSCMKSEQACLARKKLKEGHVMNK